MNETYKNNMMALKAKDLKAFNIINNYVASNLKYEVIETKIGEPTLEIIHEDNVGLKLEKFLLHSKYDPYSAEQSYIEKNFISDKKNIIYYGFGLGYHIEIVLNKLLEFQSLYIIESNIEIIKIAFMLRDLSNIIRSNQVKFIFLFEGHEDQILQSLFNDNESKLLVHQASVRYIPSKYQSLQNLLINMKMMKLGIDKNINLLNENLQNNSKIKYPQINKLFGKFKNLPIIIVSAGPSLNCNKQLLHRCKNQALVFAVGSALKPLIQVGVYPHIFCIIDPNILTYKQIEGYEDLSIPLTFLETANCYTVEKYNGPKYVISNDETKIKKDFDIIETGGSVTTAILDMAIKFGGNPIVFIGQDLAFTNYEHHAIGNMYGEEKLITDLPNLKKVKGHNGQVFATSTSLLSFKHWIELKIEKHPEITFINATENGAIIEGCKHMSLLDVINLYLSDEQNIKLELFLDTLNKI